jgi:hypothetical protein
MSRHLVTRERLEREGMMFDLILNIFVIVLTVVGAVALGYTVYRVYLALKGRE